MTRRTFSVIAAAVLVVVGAAVLTGCSADDGGAEAPPALGALRPIRSQADLVLPLDHYLPTPVERATIATARSEVIAECMADLGFSGYPVDSYRAQSIVPMHGNAYGVIDETIAREYAYAASFAKALEAQSGDIEERFGDWGSAEVQAALHGTPVAAVSATAGPTAASSSGGCAETAPRALYASVGAPPPQQVYWMDTLQGQAFQAATEDSRLKPLEAAWSRCMKAAGYDFATPTDALEDDSTREVSAAAKRTAVADVHCKWSSGYLDTYVALNTAYENRAVDNNAERLQSDLDTRQRLLAAIAAKGLGRIRDVGRS